MLLVEHTTAEALAEYATLEGAAEPLAEQAVLDVAVEQLVGYASQEGAEKPVTTSEDNGSLAERAGQEGATALLAAFAGLEGALGNR